LPPFLAELPAFALVFFFAMDLPRAK
jgi:hypothetical protein